MSSDENNSGGKRVFRATFAYLVFITIFILGTFVIVLWAYGDEPAPALLRNAHSHNDYTRERPLFDALDRGFCSVEADIYLVDGALLVAHDSDKTDPLKTLDGMYLKPLWERFQKHGAIYAEAAPFTLLIDIKKEGKAAFLALDALLATYDPMLTHFTDASTTPGAVTIVISGERATETILASQPRRVGIDGRVANLDAPLNAHQMPLISDNWFNHFTWKGEGEFPADQAAKLADIVEKTHAANIRLRFWAIPQSDAMWRTLNDAGVDVLNADDLTKLQTLLLDAQPKP